MKEQTFIIKLKDKNNVTVSFERFDYKKLNTCIKAMVRLYKAAFDPCGFCGFLYKADIEKSARVVAYKTSSKAKVWDITIEEFKQMLKTA